MASETHSLDSRAFGLACGLLWSGAVVALGITARLGWGQRWQRLLADVYKGYDETAAGLLAGGLWAFADGFTGGFLFAGLYDRLVVRLGGSAEASAAPASAEPVVEATAD